MKLTAVTNICFQRKLRPEEEADFSAVLKKSREKLGNTGHSILIIPSSSLPQAPNTNTGVGNLLDTEAIKFFDFAKQYWGINTVQLLPEGRFKKPAKGIYKPYSGSSFDLGNQIINLELLTKKELGEILSKDDFKKIIASNKESTDKINYENVLDNDSETEKALKKAYNELKKGNSEKKKELLKEFETYRIANKSWLEPKAIYNTLASLYSSWNPNTWEFSEKNLYNTDIVSIEERKKIIESIMESPFSESGRFFEFKQFIADKHLALAKEKLNNKDLKLSGDVLLSFSNDEIWANPKAFIKDSSVGWGIKALDLDSTEGKDLLKAKINKFAQRYDAIRIDVSWSYSTQTLRDSANQPISRKVYKDLILNLIDEEFKKVKGNKFRSEDIMHEFIANIADFDIYEQGQIKDFLKDRTKIYTSRNLNYTWGTAHNFKERFSNPNSYILGTTNHDCPSMRIEFSDARTRDSQAEILSKILKIPREKLNSINEFIKAKFAEPMTAKHNMIFFSDALDLKGCYKENVKESFAYRLKIPENYSDKFFKALENGEGFNIMDAIEKAFIAEGLNEQEPELFKRIVHYRKILQGINPSDTTEVLNKKSSLAKNIALYLGIAALTTIASYFIFSNNKNGNFKKVPEKKEL